MDSSIKVGGVPLSLFKLTNMGRLVTILVVVSEFVFILSISFLLVDAPLTRMALT